jgi:murein DD-endopeptidase MepM/ murein hydrolase activator NlpD
MWRVPSTSGCLVKPHTGGDPDLRPHLDPVTQEPVLTQDLHGCNYALPGLDISSKKNLASPLQSPMPGQVITFTDQWQNTTIRIENVEWVVIMLHPRSYLIRRGDVLEGRWVGVMGAQGRATGPHVHFSIYDKISKGYVDPGAFIPALPKVD